MEYKDIVDTINSPNLIRIVDNFKVSKELYESKNGINNNTMKTASMVLCKYYDGMKTIVFATKKPDTNSNSSTVEYKINKHNIGTTAYYRKNINAFEDIYTFFNLIKFKYFHEGLRKVQKPEGKKVVDFLVGLAEKYNLPKSSSSYDRTLISQEFKPTEEEREAFELGEKSLIMIDEDGIYVDDDNSSYNKTNIIEGFIDKDVKPTLKALEENELSIIKALFLIKHEGEINNLLNDFKIKLEKDFDNWERFKEEFNGELSKYVLLKTLCGKVK